MNIKNVIVHSIFKEQHQKKDIEIGFREEVLPLSVKVEALISDVLDVYKDKTGKAFGVLGGERFFSRELERLYNKETEFIDFTVYSMNELKGHMAAQPLATGGYVLFSDFENKGKQYFMVVMLKSKEGLSFDDELELMDATHLDLDKLHFAARVDVKAWGESGDGNHVSFIKGRASSSVTSYFREFLGIEEFSESSRTTQKLVTAVTNFFKEKGMKPFELELTKKEVHDYCKSKSEKGEYIYLDELSRYLDEGAPNSFLEYAQDNYEIPNEFQVDKTKLRRFLRYSGNDKSVSISFVSDVFGSRVKYNPEEDTLTVHGLPASLKEQLRADSIKS